MTALLITIIKLNTKKNMVQLESMSLCYYNKTEMSSFIVNEKKIISQIFMVYINVLM